MHRHSTAGGVSTETEKFGVTLLRALPFIALLVASFVFQLKPRGWVEVCCIVLVGVVICQLVGMLARVRSPTKAFQAMVITIIGATLIFISMRTGLTARDIVFRSDLRKYRDVVELLSRRVGLQPLSAVPVPQEYSKLASAILIERTVNGTTTVVFITGGAFPVKHSGYIYRSSDQIDEWPEGKMFAPSYRRVTSFWFGF